MFFRWLRFLFWKPFEILCRANPLVPVKITETQPAPGVRCLRFSNAPIRFLSWFAGGYDYAVVYIIDNEIIFDTGFAWGQKALRAYIKKYELNKSLHTAINSHFHEDHIGNNHLLAKEFHLKIYAHSKGIRNIVFVKEREFYRHFLFGSYVPTLVEPLKATYQSQEHQFKVIETPGHTPDHICLYDPQRKILWSGDLYISDTLSAQLQEVNGPDWIASIEKCLNYDIELLLDGHGVVFKGKQAVQEKLKQKLEFLTTLRQRVVKEAEVCRDIQEITRRVFQDDNFANHISLSEGWMAVITGGSFSRSHLVESFLHD